jgi:hypothetical protein
MIVTLKQPRYDIEQVVKVQCDVDFIHAFDMY